MSSPSPPPPPPPPPPPQNHYPLPDPTTGNCPEHTFLITRGTPSQCFIGMNDGPNKPCLDITDQSPFRMYERLYDRTVPSNKQLGYCAPEVGCRTHNDCPAPLTVDPISGKQLQSKVWCSAEHSSPIFPHVQGGHCYISAEYPYDYTTAPGFEFDECKKYINPWDTANCYLAANQLHMYADEVLHEDDPTTCEERLVQVRNTFPKIFENLEKSNTVYKDLRNDWCTGKIKPFYPKPNQGGGRDFNMLPGQHGNPVGLCTYIRNPPSSCANFNCTTLSSESQCRDHECCRYILGTPVLPKIPGSPPATNWDPSRGFVNYGLIPRATPPSPPPSI